ncbi:MAG: hypothetical protein LKM39_08335 [Chiayiivirga sp.]|jgi:hypothetical protein|nr:hypothetical protein [Chiayiivirga sp.]
MTTPGRCSGRELLQALAQQHGVAEVESFVAGGARLLEQLRARDAILGTRCANP